MKRITILLVAAVLAAALYACVPQSQPQSASSVPDASSVPSASSAQSAPDTPSAPSAPKGPEGASSAASAPAQPQQLMAQALDACVGFGPGEAGSSLKSAIAACALLDSAQELQAAQQDWADGFDRWYEQQEQERQELFWENWPALAALVRRLGPDTSVEQGLLESAGSPNHRDHYDEAAYEPMLQAIEARQPQAA